MSYRLDFINDKEFEILVCELLSSLWKTRIETFKPGKDQGIDGRLYVDASKACIIQCKHWERSGYRDLVSRLKDEELAKVRKLNPAKYIIVTSVPLSAANKAEIKGLFSPYIARDDDVFGAEDIQQLLKTFPSVVRNTPKLWLASGEVIQLFTSAAIIGRSRYTAEMILSELPRYVYTPSYGEAIRMLERLKSIVISGDPGVGKTTLAKQILGHYIGNGFQICNIEGDLSEAEGVWSEEGKQVFYFDDFLGSNYLEALDGRLDGRVLGFINRVKNSKDKRFVLTSRTVILNRAAAISEQLRQANLSGKSFELKVGNYREIDKGLILYNHLWWGGVSRALVSEVVKDRRYLSIIRHRGFNPRVIQFITDPERLVNIPDGQYWDYILGKLENPEDIWRGAYERQLNTYGRWLVLLVTLNGGVALESLAKEAFGKHLLKYTQKSPAEIEYIFGETMEVTCGSVLTRRLDGAADSARLHLFNPSLGDYVIKRHAQEPHALFEIIYAINTMSMVSRLHYQVRQGLIPSETYVAVCKSLIAAWGDHYPSVQSVELASIIDSSGEDEALLHAFRDRIVQALPTLLDGVAHRKSLHGDIIRLLGAGYSASVWADEEEFIPKAVYALMDGGMEVDDQKALSSLLDSFRENEDLIKDFQKYAIRELADGIYDSLQDGDVLSDLTNSYQLGEARRLAQEHVKELLNDYYIEFPPSAVDEILDGCDLRGILQGNQEALDQNSYGTDAAPAVAAVSEEAQLEELFAGLSNSLQSG